MNKKLNRLKDKLNFRKIVPDYFLLTTIVSEVDPKSFVVIMQGHQAMGGRLR